MATIPATLLLEERAALAMNAVTGLADDDLDGIPFFSANLLARPARCDHGDWDYGSSHGRLTDAILLDPADDRRQGLGSALGDDRRPLPADGCSRCSPTDGLTYRQTHPRVTGCRTPT